jgi:hypothetical protein
MPMASVPDSHAPYGTGVLKGGSLLTRPHEETDRSGAHPGATKNLWLGVAPALAAITAGCGYRGCGPTAFWYADEASLPFRPGPGRFVQLLWPEAGRE